MRSNLQAVWEEPGDPGGDATVLDIGRGTGRVTEALLQLVPAGRVLAIDRSADMVALARERLGGRAEVWCEDVLALEVEQPVDAIVSTATLHWAGDHDRLWPRLARALRPAILHQRRGGRRAATADYVRLDVSAVRAPK